MKILYHRNNCLWRKLLHQLIYIYIVNGWQPLARMPTDIFFPIAPFMAAVSTTLLHDCSVGGLTVPRSSAWEDGGLSSIVSRSSTISWKCIQVFIINEIIHALWPIAHLCKFNYDSFVYMKCSTTPSACSQSLLQVSNWENIKHCSTSKIWEAILCLEVLVQRHLTQGKTQSYLYAYLKISLFIRIFNFHCSKHSLVKNIQC